MTLPRSYPFTLPRSDAPTLSPHLHPASLRSLRCLLGRLLGYGTVAVSSLGGLRMPQSRMSTSPLVEADGRISRIRLSPKSPHQQHSQRKQPHSGNIAIVALVGRGFPAALTSSLEMLRQSAQHVGIDVAH